MFEVIEIVPLLLIEGFNDKVLPDKLNDGEVPCCVIVIVCAVIPVPDTVTVAIRAVVAVFALLAVKINVPLFEPLVGLTVNHV